MTGKTGADIVFYSEDAPFWYLLARRALKRAETELGTHLDSLNRRASELGIPIKFIGDKALSWAVICQLFVLYNANASNMKRRGYLRMIRGFTKSFDHRRFPPIAFKRIIANITYPSSPERTPEESVADTFLANGLTVTEGYTDSSWDDIILSRSLGDSEMMSLCDKIVSPPPDLWKATVEYYAQNRPGFFYRLSINAKNWLVD
jgi:hypothetical protein